MAHHQVHRGAQRRIGADAGVAVRAAALQPDHQVTGADGAARGLVRQRQHLAQRRDPGSDGFARAAFVLYGQRLDQPGRARAQGLHQRRELVDFAAQADQQHAGKVGMVGIAAQRALQQRETFARTRHAAAAAMRDGHHAVDVGVVAQCIAVEGLGDLPAHGGRAIDAGDDSQVVARSDPAVGAHDTLEGRLWHGRRHRAIRVANAVAARRRQHLDGMHVHMLAGQDGAGCHADDLAVLEDGAAHRDGGEGDLVSGRDSVARHDGNSARHQHQRLAGCDIDAGDSDVVCVAQLDQQLVISGHRLFSFTG